MTVDADTLTLLRDAVGGFARLDGGRVRRLRIEPGSLDRPKWSAFAAHGWLSVMVPEGRGGLGLGLEAAALIAERLGAGCLPEPYVAAGVMAPYLISHSANAALVGRVLAKLMSGEILATLAWQAEGGSLSLEDVHVIAAESNRQAVLDGSCRFVPAPAADAFLVLARRPDGLALYWIERDAPGLQITTEPLANGSTSGWLRFADVVVPTANLIAGPAQADALTTAAIDVGLIAQSAELIGAMEMALAMTLDYLRTRKQFGQAIGSFQALQHRAVDLWMHKELARHAVAAAIRVATSADATPAARGAAASSAKNRAADSALLIAKQTIQLHGAIGTTDEYDLGLYVNHMITLVPWLGNAGAHRRRFGELAAPRERVAAHP